MTEHWLVRTSLNEILGPISRDELIERILEGKIGVQDEVCRSNSYWIFLDERDEVKRQLGIEMPRTAHQDLSEEATQTDIQPTQELNVPHLNAMAEAAGEGVEGDGEGTKVLGNRGSRRGDARQLRMDRRGGYQPSAMKPLVLGNVERPSFWRFVVSGLILLTGFLVAWVIRVLQTSR